MTLEKLPVVRGDLVRNDQEWETCGLAKLTKVLKLWTRRNTIECVETADQPTKNQAEFSKHSWEEIKNNWSNARPYIVTQTKTENPKDILASKKYMFQLHKSLSQVFRLQKHGHLSPLR